MNRDDIVYEKLADKHAFAVAVARVWIELITLKSAETIATFRKKDIFLPNCISAITLWWSLVLIMTCASLFTEMLNDSGLVRR